MAGLLVSQYLPLWAGGSYDAVKTVSNVLLYVCLGFIMINVGREFEVLAEGVSKRSREQLFGRTEQNKVVVFPRGNHRIGELVRVKVKDASSATLIGEEVE